MFKFLRRLFHRCDNHRTVLHKNQYRDTSYTKTGPGVLSTRASFRCDVCGRVWWDCFYGSPNLTKKQIDAIPKTRKNGLS